MATTWQSMLQKAREFRSDDEDWNPEDTWARIVREMGDEIDRLTAELADARADYVRVCGELGTQLAKKEQAEKGGA